ncbi:ATP-dependent DNA helicase RecG [Facklamia miroungae]|uniref:ATP-dependent DNA helicase RecG n=1 Tax=Facklamia miroungae TaxID=120956 RepID=A0A1G7PQB0_9LACT|nr:ATP-dependent DNA helicase RecG [Facklamia miroungae]NKZ28790.1 ATP-dependent DNA helicase RecG [Facklamia miroungae]SDF88446.1 ATP-dependent DNA helicase RecG [Facklamia miroungae]
MEKTWLDSIDRLKGVGPKTSLLFNQLGIKTVKDLMFHFPFRFEDIQVRELETILDQEKVVLMGQVVSPPVVTFFGRKKSRLSFKLAVDDFQVVEVTFFNQPYLKKQIELGQVRAVYGKWQEVKQSLLAIKIINQTAGDDYAPIYHATKGLNQSQIIKAIKQAFTDYQNEIEEIIPGFLNDQFNLISLKEALWSMHFPKQEQDKIQAQRKIIFQEFFLYQWRLQRAKQKRLHSNGVEVHYQVEDLRQVIQTIPFDLTHSQKKAVNEICRDLLSPFPMNRLLQGDVGSGKTLVAFITMIACVQAGFQTAMMVPTEILAQQHCQSFNNYFESSGYHAEMLASEMKEKDKQNILQGLESGRIRLVIGTHALIQETVQFKSLGYLVIDEQHRFGVGQRQNLLEKGLSGHQANVLQMTATPIPRSLAQTLYADLSVSTMEGLPHGRVEIETQVVSDKHIDWVYERMQNELDKGHQIYYVLPLIQASEFMEQVENVQETCDRLKNEFPQVKVGRLHGQLNKEEQKQVMTEFKANQLQILVATTMVEVGVDVPNATVMVIQSAERFGLAQLHQLRGRVGRSSLPSYCFLIANPTTDQGKERMVKMVESQDGFELSRADMEIRGMGDVLGRNQSGIPVFTYGHPLQDEAIMTAAYQSVGQLLEQPELMTTEEAETLEKYTQLIKLEI